MSAAAAVLRGVVPAAPLLPPSSRGPATPEDALALDDAETALLEEVAAQFERLRVPDEEEEEAGIVNASGKRLCSPASEESIVRVLRTMGKRYPKDRARQAAAIAETLVATIAWRRHVGADTTLLAQSLPHAEAYHKGWPTRILGATDCFGRMIVYESVAAIDVDYLQQITSDEVALLHAQLLECLAIERRRRAIGLPHRIYSHIHVVDLAGFVLLDAMRSHVLSSCAAIFGVSKQHYSGAIKRLYITNVPMAFSAMWSVISPWLPHDTRAKIRMVRGSGAAELVEEEGVDASLLPSWIAETGRDDGTLLADILREKQQAL